jgi:DNA-binding MarR family transcriptional regulator
MTRQGGGEERAQGYAARLEEAKRGSWAQLLFKCARLLNDKALTRVQQASGRGQLRTAHTALFPHIDLGGTRLTVLAQRLGISKQAVGQLVMELVVMGVVESVPDPTDGRAKLIRFSGRGQAGLLEGLRVLGGVEAELAQQIGQARAKALHDALLALHDVLVSGAPQDPAHPRPCDE